MKNTRRIAARHRRTRKDHSTETAEDYVEAVAEIHEQQGSCRVVDLAGRFDVSHVTVTRIVSRLKKEGFVDTEPYRPIQLTEKGAKLAEASQKRHEVVYQFLLAIGVPERTAAIDAEGIEHHVSPETLECFRMISAKETSLKPQTPTSRKKPRSAVKADET
ncbi:manganese-binding transcriptional regulator MntR [Planctomicrobium sp. SH661]|uniref:manganese-binding transcriptional regulator MntR n=1 Tax=Planctomicrobium sp. SH661 TaxID=3448124 RepID=UPI003F5C0F07